MKKIIPFCAALLVLSAAFWQSCQKGDLNVIDFAEHDAEFAFPLFNTELKVSDLVNNILKENTTGDTIIVNPDNTLTLFYSGDVTESKASDIIDFLIPSVPLLLDTSYYEFPVQTPDGIGLYFARLSAGKMTVAIVNTLAEPINITFYIPQLSLNGQIYSFTFNNVQPGQTVFTPQVDLAGWELNTANNLITFRYDAFLLDGTQVYKLPNTQGGSPAVLGGLQGLTFTYVEGKWERTEYALNTDTIDIEINKTNLDGNVQVKNPKVTITVYNSFGFPTRGLIKYLRFRLKNGDLVPLESPLIQQGSDVGIDFAYPSFAAGEVGQTKSTVFYFDNTNSNIEFLFNSQPTQMIYQVNGLANADSDPNLIGFMTDSSSVRMNVSVELLLEGQLKNFGADQSLDLNFGDLAAETAFESAEFKLVTENSMGLSTSLQVYFQDAGGNNLDSLFVGGPQDIIKAGPLDVATGITTGSTRTETFIPFTAERFENLRKNAKKAFLQTYFTSALNGSVPVKILSNQGAVVKMGVKVKQKF